MSNECFGSCLRGFRMGYECDPTDNTGKKSLKFADIILLTTL